MADQKFHSIRGNAASHSPIYYFHYGDFRDPEIAEQLRSAAYDAFAERVKAGEIRFGATQGTSDSHGHNSNGVPEGLRAEIEAWAAKRARVSSGEDEEGDAERRPTRRGDDRG